MIPKRFLFLPAIAIILISLLTPKAAQAVTTERVVVPNLSQCPSGDTCYTTIQAAVDAADTTQGDTVRVEPGTYPGPVTLRSNVPMRGRETARTFITGGSTGTAIIANGVTGVSIKNFTFTNATVAISVTNSDLIITNNIFDLSTGSGVTAVQIQSTAAAPQIINNTFYQNRTAISSNINLTIKNNIFFGNTTHLSSTALVVGSITYNAFSDTNPSGPDLTGTTNLLSTDPLFVDPASNDFHLKQGSPCIDAGDSNITDFVDTTRSDIGAYGGSNNLDSIPMRISGLSVTGTTGTSITLNFTANNCYLITTDNIKTPANPRGYRVYYGATASGNYDGSGGTLSSPVQVDLRTQTAPPFTLGSLTPSVVAPAAPTLLQPTPANMSLNLTWTAVGGVTGYKVHYGIASTAENTIDVGNVVSYTLQGLTNGQTYKIAISAYAQATYYIAVTAYDNTGLPLDPGVSHESAYSQEIFPPIKIGPVLESVLSNEVSDFPEAITPFPNLPNKGCFIATAAYGHYSAPQVQALRDFRDRYLMTSALGRAFVRWYYEHGPVAAQYVNDHPWLKPVVRTALLPVVGGAMFMTKTPGLEKAMILSLLIGGIGYLLYRRQLLRSGGRQ